MSPDLSIVIPLLNERESLGELHSRITAVMQAGGYRYEIIFIDDGSGDGSWENIKSLAEKDPGVKGIRFRKNYGKSQALHAGFDMAEGEVVITMDADLQDSPEEIHALYELIQNKGYDLVSGWKKKRKDNAFTKNLPSKLFNFVARRSSGIKLHDFNCGLKAYKNEVIKSIEVTGQMHRYIPVLVKNAGYTKIGEKVVEHSPRKFGVTKFGPSRFLNGFLDLLTIWFLSKFGKQPMHFFGAWGVLMLFIGFLLTLYLGIDKLFINPEGQLITQLPQFYLALVTMVIGAQLFLAGFLGELILRNSRNRTDYRVKETV